MDRNDTAEYCPDCGELIDECTCQSCDYALEFESGCEDNNLAPDFYFD
jgi:hypothetical protein